MPARPPAIWEVTLGWKKAELVWVESEVRLSKPPSICREGYLKSSPRRDIQGWRPTSENVPGSWNPRRRPGHHNLRCWSFGRELQVPTCRSCIFFASPPLLLNFVPAPPTPALIESPYPLPSSERPSCGDHLSEVWASGGSLCWLSGIAPVLREWQP